MKLLRKAQKKKLKKLAGRVQRRIGILQAQRQQKHKHNVPLDQRGQFTKLMQLGAANALDKIYIESTLMQPSFAMDELEKNLIVQRLEDGRKKQAEKVAEELKDTKKMNKKPRLGLVTEKGTPKSCGIASTLEVMGKLSLTKLRKVREAIKKHDQGGKHPEHQVQIP